MKKRLLVLYLSVIFYSALADVYSFRTLDNIRSLYGNSINTLIEDNEGYLWIGTAKGLFRYDGYSLYPQNEHTPAQLPSNEYVTNLQEDGNHYLWISRSAASDYAVLDARRRKVSTSDYIQSLGMGTAKQYLMHIDHRGDLWRVTEDSVCHYDIRNGILHGYATPGLSSASNKRITAKAYKNTLYILDGKWLYSFSEEKGEWKQEELDMVLPLLGNDANGVMLADSYIDKSGGLWIYSLFTEDILYRDNDHSQWHHITLPHDDRMGHNSIRRVVEDRENGIWIATDHRGLFLYSLTSGQFQHFEYDVFDHTSISSNNINAVLVDSHHTLWLGYFKTGISYCRPSLDLVIQHTGDYGDVTALLAEDNGTRWIGTDGQGLWQELPDGRVLKFSQIPSLTVTDLQQGKEGSIWVATYDHGLFRILPTGMVKHYTAQSGQLPHDGIGRLAFDGYGRLWVCSPFGAFFCFNPKTETYQVYRSAEDSDLMGSALCYDSYNNRMIMATYYGLWIHNLQIDEGNYMLGARDGQQPLHVFQESNLLVDDHAQLIWMSHDQGVTVWDTQADTLYLISQEQGIEHTIQSLRQDGQHNVWASSVSGLSMIQSTKRSDGVWDFKVRSLLTSEDMEYSAFNAYAGAYTSQGRMLFGRMGGYSEFDSRSILSVASARAVPMFSTITVGDSVIYEDDLLHLGQDDTPLTISFYTGNPLGASDVRYSYRVKGLQEEWIDTRANSIPLLSLPAGTYDFELRAIGLNGEWSNVISLPMHVSPPWWNSTFMRLTYAIGLIVIGFVLVWTTKVRQRRKGLAERQKLNQLLVSLEQLIDEPLPPPVIDRLKDMHQRASQLMGDGSSLADTEKPDEDTENL